MKVSRKQMQVDKRPIFVSENQYEIWYSKPVALGKVNYKNGYWWTADGLRFISSRDAMEYLISVYEKTGKKLEELSEVERLVATAPVNPPALVTKLRRKESVPAHTPQETMFREFLKWQSQQSSGERGRKKSRK